MKKILKSLVISMIIVCSMTASIFAISPEDVRKQLLSVGVPSSYVGAVVEYLQKTTISQADYNKVVSYIDEAKSIIGDINHISELSDSDKIIIKNLATKAGNTLGLEVTFSKEDGITTLIITDNNGNNIVKMDTLDVIESVTNFNPSIYVELVETMVEFSNNSEKGEFQPVGGELTQTATPYANKMIVGIIMIIAGVALIYKKQLA